MKFNFVLKNKKKSEFNKCKKIWRRRITEVYLSAHSKLYMNTARVTAQSFPYFFMLASFKAKAAGTCVLDVNEYRIQNS